MRPLAIIIQNVIQWYSVKPLAKYLKKNSIKFDIIIFNPQGQEEGYENIAKALAKTITEDGFKVDKASSSYKVCLAPYSNMISFNCKYKIGYCYGAATTKPSLTLQPEFKNGFHAMFLHDTYGAELFSIYSRIHIVPYLYLNSTHQAKNHSKPTILYLPTYHEKNIPETAKALKELKNKYYIITKSHHGTENLKEESLNVKLLKEISDECYKSTQYIGPLFKKTDVVLSDNSGAIMDALYAKIPVSMAAREFSPAFHGIKPLQQELFEKGIIPYTRIITPKRIDRIITQALSSKQREIQFNESEKLFPIKKGGAKAWYTIIKKYLNDEIDQNYCKLHDYYTNFILSSRQNEINLHNKINNINNKVQKLENELSKTIHELEEYKNSRAHRLIQKALKPHRKVYQKRQSNNKKEE